jgi:23S rRNA (guanosine2251-2'-O)-methyltransferase
MTERRFAFRECLNPDCRFRYPVAESDPIGNQCPACGSDTRRAAQRTLSEEASPTSHPPKAAPHPPLCGLLDNVRSVFNAGSIFRSADGAGIHHIYLAGMTPTPDHPKFAKTSLGAEQRIPWSRSLNAVDLAVRLHREGMRLWALEDTADAVPLFTCRLTGPEPVVLIVGNEVAGVDPDLLALSDRVLSIPMWGIKHSLNVAIAFGIAVYWLRGTSV